MSLEDLFIKVYKVNYQKVYDFAYKLSGDRHRAKDIAQQCFLRLWERMDMISSEEEDIFPLLYVIAKRVVIDESRKAALVSAAHKNISQVTSAAADEMVHSNLHHKQLQSRLSNILRTMPEKPRRVYQFRYSGYSHKEIATMLNISVTTVRSHLKTATYLIRKSIGNMTLLVLSCLFISACSKDKGDIQPSGPVTTQEVNQWILDSMQYFYYWKDGLPATADQQLSAPDYFHQLRNAADRFSFIYDPANANTLPTSLRSVYGMEATVIGYPQAPGGALGVIQLVQAGSPAASKDLERGGLFTRINGTLLNSTNATTLLQQLATTGKGSLTRATINADGTITEGNVQEISRGGYTEEPAVQQSDIWTLAQKKTGYLCFNYFDDTQSAGVLAAFNQFKQAGVTQLILDLRYSPGGSVAMAAVLCALIGNNISEESIFVKYTGNSHLGNRNMAFSLAMSLPENGTAVTFEQVRPLQLRLNKVYILTGNHTASAAELMVNNLKPYATVVQIGTTTLGKDEGMVTIADKRTPKRIPWILMPVTYKLQNATGAGGYNRGIAPLYPIDELASLPLAPLGSTKDPLIAKAVELISTTGARRQQPLLPVVQPVGTAPAMAYPVIMHH
ncbi:sigma-70 family RNA polymerase sigma factor [Chitinophaga nivalis]|uniref:Sigma-70 family RNA polymerase sigma factor n=1 Tax=Chitinophaga nivalis TaxID=2991709 RepID=A0ABT3IIF2_9BACT|nr:sigma-70 family RNA polymerase sigma factor [Chitinophaga nivalis]MCW3466598.1 sigma-70 family RNA polymerase sigma factor [Chitinophaga nivalis]MCW3483711.1 sigma-70 family RNA polymerase sigma factor [Chitinophaga nivalis]